MSEQPARTGDVALALYRTYRPGTLAEVMGQEPVTVPLARAVDAGKAHHAYLFTGPRGCGKTSSARILARCLNCENGPTSTPCGTCDSCIALAPNGPGSVDVVELDAATHGGVDEARDLRERAMYAPVSSRFRVYIIDEAHQLSNAAANALLKLIEEPPPHLKFVFATTEPDKIIGTIRSRTHHYPFRLIPVRTLAKLLEGICAKEGITHDEGSLTAVARAAAGSARDALSILGQVASGAGQQGLVEAEVVAQLGVTDRRLLDGVIDALITRDGAAMFAALDSIIDGGIEPRRFAGDLLERLRDVVVLATVPDAASLGLIDAPDDSLAVLTRQAADMGATAASHAAAMVSDGLSELRGAMAPRLQVELLCARLLAPGLGGGIDALASRVDDIQRRLDGLPPGVSGVEAARAAAANARIHQQATADVDAPVATSAAATAASAPASSPTASAPASAASTSAAGESERPATPKATSTRKAPPPISKAASAPPPVAPTPQVTATPTGAVDADAIRAAWPAVMDAVRAESRVVWAMLSGATPTTIDGATVRVGLPNDNLVRTATSRDAHLALAAAIAKVCNCAATVVLEVGASAAADSPAPLDASDNGGARIDDADAGAPPNSIDLIATMLGGTVIEEIDRSDG